MLVGEAIWNTCTHIYTLLHVHRGRCVTVSLNTSCTLTFIKTWLLFIDINMHWHTHTAHPGWINKSSVINKTATVLFLYELSSHSVFPLCQKLLYYYYYKVSLSLWEDEKVLIMRKINEIETARTVGQPTFSTSIINTSVHPLHSPWESRQGLKSYMVVSYSI